MSSPPPVPGPGSERTVEARAARGGAFVLGSQATQLAIGLGSTMILARLLVPADFGLVAMAGIVVGAMLTFKDFGLGLAVAQRDQLDAEDLSALFWWSLAYTSGLALLTAASGPGLAWFFDEPSLARLTFWLAGGLWLSGLANIPLGLLRQRLRFGTIAVADVVSTAVGAALAVYLAFAGHGVWALVYQQVTQLTLHAVLVIALARWRPGALHFGHRSEASSALKRFGGETTAVRLLNEIAEQLDRILVGRLAGTSALGLYQMSHRWSTLPALQLLVPLKGVAIAGLSRLRADPVRYRAAAREAFTAVLSLVLPVLAFLVADAEVVIPTLLGDAWRDAIPVFRLLAVAAFLGCASRLMIWIYLAEARTAERLRFTLFARPLSMLLVAAGAPFGPLGIAAGYTVGKGIVSIANVFHACANSPVSAADFARAAARPCAAAIGAGAIVAVAGDGRADLLRLLLDGALFSLLYVVSWLAIPGGLARARHSIGWLGRIR